MFQPRELRPDLEASSGAEAQVQENKEPQIPSDDPLLVLGVGKSQSPRKSGGMESITSKL